MIWWAIAYSAPGGDAWHSAALNSLVHVAMYTYYYLASLSSSPGKWRIGLFRSDESVAWLFLASRGLRKQPILTHSLLPLLNSYRFQKEVLVVGEVYD